MTKAVDNRIVLSEKFFLKIKNDLVNLGLPDDYGCLSKVSGKFLEQFRGVPESTEYRILDA
jgi:hypothetical protein